MKRKTITELLAFAERCVQEKSRTGQADRVLELALELAKARDRKMLSEIKNPLSVGESQ